MSDLSSDEYNEYILEEQRQNHFNQKPEIINLTLD